MVFQSRHHSPIQSYLSPSHVVNTYFTVLCITNVIPLSVNLTMQWRNGFEPYPVLNWYLYNCKMNASFWNQFWQPVYHNDSFLVIYEIMQGKNPAIKAFCSYCCYVFKTKQNKTFTIFNISWVVIIETCDPDIHIQVQSLHCYQ